jgi:drug/metabolite transporter (DMT)-like permease
MDKKLLALVALLSSAVIWGVTVPLLKVNLETFPPFSLAFARFLIATLVAAYLSQLSGLKLRDFLNIGLVSLFGITLNIGLLFLGLQRTTIVDASFVFALGPVITSLLAVIIIREKINFPHLLGICLAFLGSFLYILYPLLFGSINFKVDLVGDLLVLASSISGSIYIIGSKKLFETYTPTSISAVSFTVGALTFAPIALLESFQSTSWLGSLTFFNLASLIFFGLGSSFAAYSLYEWGLTKVAVHIDATISYLIPIVSIIVATLFMGERLEPIFGLSFVLVDLGIYLVSRFHPPTLHHHYHRHHHKA